MVVWLFASGHQHEQEQDLFRVVVLSDEGIHRHKLTERSAAQLECGVDVPRLGTGKELELLISGKNQVSPTPESQVSAQELWWDMVSC